MNQPGLSTNPEPDQQMVEMLAGMNAAADIKVVQRTRRAVMQAAAELRERRRRSRRNVAITLLTVAVLVLVLSPAIWSTIDDFFAGERWFGLQSMVMVLALLLFSTIVAALIGSFRGHQEQGIDGRR